MPSSTLCDEIGYLSRGQQGSHLFFQVISQRHQQKSTVITTNLPFAEWEKVFDSTTVATAVAAQLVHDSEVVTLVFEHFLAGGNNKPLWPTSKPS